ncbi:MAG: HU family DNA-binding protein [Endomicrobium sp.]|nr:HU family DNA-binding protein [Endomicrobium sp.]
MKALVKVIQTSLQSGEIISLSGLGSFRAKSRKERLGRNHKTGEIMPLPPGKKCLLSLLPLLEKLYK